MDIQTIVNVCISIMTFLVITLIPSIILMVKNYKKAKKAKTEAEKSAALNELNDVANKLIAEAEKAYASVNEALKSKGSSAGAMKKDKVLFQLQSYCTKNNLEFDAEYWNNKIDEIVALTKQVNK